jgi:hypothetical protein
MACVSQPSPLFAARQRAQALADSGDLGQARAVLEHAVDLGRGHLGEDDPDVLLTAHQLAGVHQRADDPSGARRVLEEAYAAGQWRLGDADPVMLGISFDLGMVAEEMENRHEARRAFGRVAAHGPAVLGADHWAVVRARSYLGEDPPTVRMELPSEQLERFQFPAQRETPQDRQAPARPEQGSVPRQQDAQPGYFPSPQDSPPTFPQPAPPSHDRAAQRSGPPSYEQTAQHPGPPSHEQTAQHPGPPSHEQTAQHPGPPSHEQTAVPSYDSGPSHYQFGPPSYQPALLPPVDNRAGLHHSQPGYYGQPSAPPAVSGPPVISAGSAGAGDSSYSRKAPAVFAAIAAVFGVIIAVVALVVVLAHRGDDPASDVPTLSGPAPSNVRMRDYGSSVKLFWADPANGRVSFVITGGRPGEQLRPMGQVGPTTTTFDLNGLNADLDYCFAVVAVYTTSQFSTSPQTCTSRAGRSTAPSPGK